jgi:hypothetical protein
MESICEITQNYRPRVLYLPIDLKLHFLTSLGSCYPCVGMGGFVDEGIVLVKGFCAPETADVFAEELVLSRENSDCTGGTFNRDSKISGNVYSFFAPFDGALRLWLPKVERVVGAPLVPINSFARIYGHGSELLRHSDLSFLQIGVSICLRRDNVDWPFCATDRLGRDVSLSQQQGDAVVYAGELRHWRQGAYRGTEQAQLFLHYCLASGPFATTHRFRGRKNLGITSSSSAGWSRLLSRGYRRLRRVFG